MNVQVTKDISPTQQIMSRDTIILSKYKAGSTLEKIGEEFSISRERVRQIVDRTLAVDLDTSKNINPNLFITIEKRRHNRQRLVNRLGLKRYRFRKAMQGRLEKLGHQFSLLVSYANRNAYEYTEKDVVKIFSEIERKVREVKAKFHLPKDKEFKL